MGFRFRKSLKLFPGVRLNLSKSGASVSIGPRGLRYTVGPKGTRVTAGIPGTGLSVSQFTPYRPPASSAVLSPPSRFEPQAVTSLQPIESAPAEAINELSTSELAPILHEAQRRLRFARFILVLCLLIFIAAFLSNDQALTGATALLTAVFVPAAIFLDRYRRSVQIDYRPDETFQKIAAAIEESFADIKASHYVWNISAQGRTADWKRNAGASMTTKRERVYPGSKRPACIRGRVSFPFCTVGKEQLYFLPDALLIVAPASIAALRYSDFSASLVPVRFIEDQSVPRDTAVIGNTWRFVNKNGGPDRRFNYNKQIPICLYGELSLVSPSGLNELLHLSNPNGAERFVKVMDILHSFNGPASDAKSIKSVRNASRWPSLIFWTLLLLVAVPLAALSFVSFQRQHSLNATASSTAATNADGGPSPSSVGSNVPPPGVTVRTPVSQTRAPTSRTENVPLPRPRPMQ